MSTLVAVVRRAAQVAGDSIALISPKQNLQWSYSQLDTNVRQLAGGLRELGVKRGDVVASDVPNIAENLQLQLALSHLGATFSTFKNIDAFKATTTIPVCTVISNTDSWLAQINDLSLPTIVLGDEKSEFTNFSELAQSSIDEEDPLADIKDLLATYNGAALSQEQAITLGSDAANILSSTASDKTCVSITLCHSFGLGSGVGSALLSGGAVVLPAAGGIKGCGDPVQRASVTFDVLQSTGASLLFADTHILKNLPEAGDNNCLKLRNGVVKVGSGTDIFDNGTGMNYGGVSLFAMGKRP